jgi:hypothetical protein
MKYTVNRGAWERELKNLGAVSIEWSGGGTHASYRAVMRDGLVVTGTTPYSWRDPYLIRGWARQVVNRARRGQRTNCAS